MRRIDISGVLLLSLLIVLRAGISFAVADDNILLKVRNVKFVGVNELNKKEFVDSLAAKAPPFWKFWVPLSVIHIKDLADDTFRIKQYYQAQGYYQATAEYVISPISPQEGSIEQSKVVKSPEQLPDKNNDPDADPVSEYDITFQIKEGLPVTIRDISINCQCELEIISDADIRESLRVKPGRIFKTEEYEKSKVLIRKLLGNQAYPFAEVSGNATVDLNDNSVDITFDIDSGQLYNFGDIHITGHEDYVREEVIRRAITFKSGEKFAAKDIDESRRNLFDLNIFKTAVVNPGDPNTGGKTLPVDITIKPKKKRNVKLGIGYGTDDGLRLQAGWSYRNLTGRADRLTLRARRSDIVENIYAEYLLPYFLSARNNLVSTAGFGKEEKDYYTLKRTNAEVNLYRKLEENWFSSIGYNLEKNRPEDVSVEDAEGEVDPRDTESYLVSSVKFSIEHNTVDDVLNSQKGSVVRFSFENASSYLGSEISYICPGIETKMYIPIFWDMVLAGRMDFATIKKSEDTGYIPISNVNIL